MDYTCELTWLLPLPFPRGEGRGEGSICVVYPAVSSVCVLRAGGHRGHQADRRRHFQRVEPLPT